MKPIVQSRKLHKVRYDVRGPILVEAQRLEAEGHKILKLNIGNTAPFGFEAPEAIVADMVHNLPDAQGYSDSRGIYSARTAVAQYYQSRGLRDTKNEDVFIGNGVSELISMVLTAFIDEGNEILVPAPDYPLWTGAVTLAGGTPVHYKCDESNGWNPDLEDIESKITPNTHALVVINPNNPTGAVYSEDILKGLVDIARRHDLVLMADEIYEKILYQDADGTMPVMHHVASFAGDDVLTLTFSGLSKAYRVCGYRAGWVMISGPKHMANDFLEGLTLLSNMRMCANVPAQHAIQTALGGYQSINELIVPGGRFYEQIKLASRLLNDIPGVFCKPRRALLLPASRSRRQFDRRRPEFVIDLLRAKKILVTHGTGFNWFAPDHFRSSPSPTPRSSPRRSYIADFPRPSAPDPWPRWTPHGGGRAARWGRRPRTVCRGAGSSPTPPARFRGRPSWSMSGSSRWDCSWPGHPSGGTPGATSSESVSSVAGRPSRRSPSTPSDSATATSSWPSSMSRQPSSSASWPSAWASSSVAAPGRTSPAHRRIRDDGSPRRPRCRRRCRRTTPDQSLAA